MPAEKLTIAKIRAAKPHPIPTTKNGHPRFAKYGDGRGLWLIVGPNCRKTWLFTYTINKRTRHMGLGPIEDYGPLDQRSLDKVREKARELRNMVKAGVDPKVQLAAEREAALANLPGSGSSGIPTFREAAERCMDARALMHRWSPRTELGWRNTMRDYVLPRIGDLPVDAVGLEEVLTILRPIWSKREIGPRVRGRIGVVMSFAASKGWRADDNITRAGGPIDHELKPHSKSEAKNHDAMDYRQLPSFMRELRANRGGFAPRALEFLILTAARTTEVLEAEWEEMDFENRLWVIPASRMKMKRDHVVPLSPSAMRLLKALPREADNPYVFPSPTKPGAPLSNMAMTNVLKRMKRKDGITVHGFRTTFRTWADEKNLDIPNRVAEAALAHTIQGVEGVYNRGTHLETRRTLMRRWAVYGYRGSGATS